MEESRTRLLSRLLISQGAAQQRGVNLPCQPALPQPIGRKGYTPEFSAHGSLQGHRMNASEKNKKRNKNYNIRPKENRKRKEKGEKKERKKKKRCEMWHGIQRQYLTRTMTLGGSRERRGGLPIGSADCPLQCSVG